MAEMPQCEDEESRGCFDGDGPAKASQTSEERREFAGKMSSFQIEDSGLVQVDGCAGGIEDVQRE
jgi:hypothetical protein